MKLAILLVLLQATNIRSQAVSLFTSTDRALGRSNHVKTGLGTRGGFTQQEVRRRQMSSGKGRVLVLDVDGTLYGRGCGVEQQIVDGIYRFFKEELGLSEEDCDILHQKYGSTIGGLQVEGRLRPDQVERFYQEAYSLVDMSSLYAPSHPSSFSSPSTSELSDATGYQHHASIAAMLRSHRGPIFLASNSPLDHVRRVLAGVGLADITFEGVLTPDTRGGINKSDPEFYKPIVDAYPPGEDLEVWLLDDSSSMLEVASQLGMKTLWVGEGERGRMTLERAVACFLGAIPHPDHWTFSDKEYLRCKNVVDEQSRSLEVWKRLEEEVSQLDLGSDKTLRVADLGCGLLPFLGDMRRLMLGGSEVGAGEGECQKEGKEPRRLEYSGLETERGVVDEACQILLGMGFSASHGEGELPPSKSTRTFWMGRDDASGAPETVVRIIHSDFTTVNPGDLFPSFCPSSSTDAATIQESTILHPSRSTPPLLVRRPHVLIGCCLADLFPPEPFVRTLCRLAGEGGCLLYLPITFAGKTEMCPPAGQEGSIPSDDAILSAYDEGLCEDQGHHTQIHHLLQSIHDHGGEVLESSQSNWVISRGRHPQLWECLLHFIGMGVAPRVPHLEPSGGVEGETASTSSVGRGGAWERKVETPRGDIRGWVQRTRARSPTLVAHNVDLLARGFMGMSRDLGKIPMMRGGWAASQGKDRQGGKGITSVERGGAEEKSLPDQEWDNSFLMFTGPRELEVHQERVERGAVGPGQILVESICSSISSGTELKVFKGDFASDTELDTTIKGMAGERMEYPLRYGYSLVGRVVLCGEGVPEEDYLGHMVFTFSPHSSMVIADAHAVMVVPDGIKAEDAVYLPAVETALSLVHDTHPRVGERVAVFGQGMIGLLAVAILSKTHGSSAGGSVVAVDMLEERLAVATRLGATSAVSPQELPSLSPFDVSVEVTGNYRGLQAALDFTGYGGRVILGSWYGNTKAMLSLGMAFHRSHLTIQTSQVSSIPASLTDRWDKPRRFAAAWSLLKDLRPSNFLTTLRANLAGAQGAYEALEGGKELGVVLTYGIDSDARAVEGKGETADEAH